MDTDDTKPRFTKIKLVNKSNVVTDIIQIWYETVGEETYVSSKRFRERNVSDGMIIQGPCMSTANGEFDTTK